MSGFLVKQQQICYPYNSLRNTATVHASILRNDELIFLSTRTEIEPFRHFVFYSLLCKTDVGSVHVVLHIAAE